MFKPNELTFSKNTSMRIFSNLKAAVEKNQANNIDSFIRHLALSERKNALIPQDDFNFSGMSILHYTAVGTADSKINCCYESAEKIRSLVFSAEESYHWLELLKHQTARGQDTVIHLAARQGLTDLIHLLARGLSSEDWLLIVLLKNKSGKTALNVVCNELSHASVNQIDECINALIGPLSQSDKENLKSQIPMELDRVHEVLPRFEK